MKCKCGHYDTEHICAGDGGCEHYNCNCAEFQPRPKRHRKQQLAIAREAMDWCKYNLCKELVWKVEEALAAMDKLEKGE